MNKIIFKCQAITPMFLGGADGEPDLRPPSIKGAMRYWWRAMHGHLSIEKLKEKESDIFGNTEQRSKVTLRCRTSHEPKEFIETFRKVKAGEKGELEGMEYLFYSMDLGKNNRQYFDNIPFEVILKSKDKHEAQLKEAAYAFWLLANLGGIGSRSRRGGGSFIITDIEDDSHLGFDFRLDVQSADAWVDYLKKGIQTIKHHAKVKDIKDKTRFNSFQNIDIYLVNELHGKAEDALNFIGERFQKFREEEGGKDAYNVGNYVDNGSHIPTIEKASFGLPISYRFEVGKNKFISATVEPKSEIYNRSASSLFISIVQIGGKYYPLLVNFNSTLLPDGVSLKVSSKEQRKDVYPKTPHNTIKQDFIHSLKTIQIL